MGYLIHGDPQCSVLNSLHCLAQRGLLLGFVHSEQPARSKHAFTQSVLTFALRAKPKQRRGPQYPLSVTYIKT